ncbi:GTP-binding protein Era [hydrothermal vent metagenome]|uniref:GTP-binding protein Era n=1 Tax=hydrothermal vent metagenome TaxID=652676 RepID=A0A3B1B7F6_9ZZZZ
MNMHFRCGYIAILGRPNVGKSTLLNHLIGQKLSITSRKPQTTRHQILGIKTTDDAQFVFVDTPGIHKGGKQALHRYLNRAARSIVQDMDLIVFVVEARRWEEQDDIVLSYIKEAKCPVMLVINKIDLIKDKDELLPYLEQVGGKHSFVGVVPVSANKNLQLDTLLDLIKQKLPESEAHYPPDQLTTRSSNFVAAEMIREKLVRLLGDELPYATTVEIEKFEDTKKLLRLHAIIWVERDNQKSIVIGKKGEKIKKIGVQARKDLQNFFEKKVHLETWVKVRKGWADDERALQQLGYIDEF